MEPCDLSRLFSTCTSFDNVRPKIRIISICGMQSEHLNLWGCCTEKDAQCSLEKHWPMATRAEARCRFTRFTVFHHPKRLLDAVGEEGVPQLGQTEDDVPDKTPQQRLEARQTQQVLEGNGKRSFEEEKDKKRQRDEFQIFCPKKKRIRISDNNAFFLQTKPSLSKFKEITCKPKGHSPRLRDGLHCCTRQSCLHACRLPGPKGELPTWPCHSEPER